MIMNRLHGTEALEYHAGFTIGEIDKARMTRMIESFADISLKLACTTYDAIESLDLGEDGSVVVGSDTTFIGPGTLGQPVFGGPYQTSKDRYLFAIDQMLVAIRKGWTHRGLSMLFYLIYLEARRYVTDWKELAIQQTEFYLSHPDPHAGNQLFVNDKITGYIDLEWCVICSSRV